MGAKAQQSVSVDVLISCLCSDYVESSIYTESKTSCARPNFREDDKNNNNNSGLGLYSRRLRMWDCPHLSCPEIVPSRRCAQNGFATFEEHTPSSAPCYPPRCVTVVCEACAANIPVRGELEQCGSPKYFLKKISTSRAQWLGPVTNSAWPRFGKPVRFKNVPAAEQRSQEASVRK